jgi:hypothetical protein
MHFEPKVCGKKNYFLQIKNNNVDPKFAALFNKIREILSVVLHIL